MANSQRASDVFFNRSCPVCGRRLQIRVQLLGRRVYCQHCGGGFTAVDDSLANVETTQDRVEDLISRASRMLAEATHGDEQDFSG